MNPPARTIRSGSYAAGTTRQLQGKASNKTEQYLAGLDAQDPGNQAFYREALVGIPNPMQAGQSMSYGQLQDALAGPKRAAMLAAYAEQNRMDKTPTAQAYQQAMFDQARAQMLQRGAEKPGELAFPVAADAARRVPNTAQAIAHGNYVAPAGTAVVDAASLAQRHADVAGGSAYVAPGMAMSAPPVVVTPAPARRTIRVAKN